MADVKSTLKPPVAMGANESKSNEPVPNDVVNEPTGAAIVQNGVDVSNAPSDVTNVIQSSNEANVVGNNVCSSNSTSTNSDAPINAEESHDVTINGDTQVSQAETLTHDVIKNNGNVSNGDAAKERRIVEDMTDKLLTSWMSDATAEIESRQEPPSLAKRFSISHFATDDVITRDDVDASGFDEEQRRKELLADEIDDMDYDLDDDVTSGKKEVGASGHLHRDVDIGDVTAAAMPDPSQVMAMLQGGAAGPTSEPDPEESLPQEYYYSDDSDFEPQETKQTNNITESATQQQQQQQKSLPVVDTIKSTEPEVSPPIEKSTSDSGKVTKPHTTSSLEALEASLDHDRLSLKKPTANLGSYDYLLSSKSNRSISHYNELLKLQMDISKIQRCMSEMQTQVRALSRTVDFMTEQAESDIGN